MPGENITALFTRELEHERARIVDIEYPQYVARERIPQSPDPADPGAKSIRLRVRDRVGMMRLIHDYSESLPSADVGVSEKIVKVKVWGSSIRYSRDDIRGSVMAGRSLPQEKANAAREIGEETFDEVMCLGVPEVGIEGLLTHSNIPQMNAAEVDGNRDWANKDPDDWVADITAGITEILDETHGREAGPFVIDLPVAQYALLAQTRNSDASDTTVLSWLTANNPYIATIRPWWRLKGAGEGGSDRMLIWTPRSDKVSYEEPLPFTMHEEQWRGLAAEVPCELKMAGVLVTHPKSAHFVDEI